MAQSRGCLTRRSLTGPITLLSAVILQIGMCCPIVTMTTAAEHEQSLSWYTLFRMVDGVGSVIGGIDTIERGRFWIAAALILLQAGIVMLAVSGIGNVIAPRRSMRLLGAAGGGTVLLVTVATVAGMYVKISSFSFRVYRRSIDIQPTLYIMATVAAAVTAMCIWDVLRKKESAI